jgi:uncharacterized protein YecA (UPF0149 family)
MRLSRSRCRRTFCGELAHFVGTYETTQMFVEKGFIPEINSEGKLQVEYKFAVKENDVDAPPPVPTPHRRSAVDGDGDGYGDGDDSRTIRGSTVAVGRNVQCPCGSGKKYKRCHGRR